MNLTRPQQTIYHSLIYICGFLLFLEWLRPLDEIAEFNNVGIFFVYAGYCFFISFLQFSWLISVPLKLAGLVFIIDGSYIAERIFSRDWFSAIYDQFLYNIHIIQAQEWWQMTPMFRTLLFLVLLWLMSYLLYYWFIIAKRMLLFILMTIIYVTVIDTFTIYDGKWAIIRTFVVAMIALGLTHFFKEMERESIALNNQKFTWMAPLITFVLFASVLGYAAPKLEPQWPDPVPYLTSGNPGAGSGYGDGVQKVGYGENDSRLGGGFIQDDTLVFRAFAQDDQYWRIESKDTYTGRGWEDTLQGETTMVSPFDLEFSTFTENVETEERVSYLSFTGEANFNKLVYAYGARSVNRFPQDMSLQLHNYTGEIDTLRGGNPTQVESYILDYDSPSFEYNQLREASDEDPEEIIEFYTQLPDSLPERVRELAGEIIDDQDNRYDQVKAVETYFSANGFEYETENVAVPGEEEDYVDQFLFETQVGYCDNFSTSMVVLLRSQGIPARWVKGFTGGERLEERAAIEGEELSIYEVTSGNAHSWVEVYFPDVGWVPFEPTQGFSNNTDFFLEVEDSEGSDAETEEGGGASEAEESDMENPNQAAQQDQTETVEGGAADSNNDNFRLAPLLIALAVIASLGSAAYFTRFRWLSGIYGRRFKNNPNGDTFERAYLFLLKALEHRGLKRYSGQTLRDFAARVDSRYQSGEMRQLTHYYERTLYRNEMDRESSGKVTELWENLIKKTLS
ncbi:transglutaminase domain-containing protein [Halobacillus sp. Marseille-Q1614]|uniref:transglutaminase TgpA family protein n=1 Tax=Halobacillus sp. Marseille-Q1614 TaxID=2709134 RepID=UPI0015705D57|nr:transglutaminase domain-containing protein [Halobacillus sp. Marseille-Q1614]